MAVREVFCGGEIESLRVTGGVVDPWEPPNSFNPALSASSIRFNSSGVADAIFTDPSGALTDIPAGENIWVHIYLYPATSVFYTVLDNTGRALVRLQRSGNTLSLEENTSVSGTTWTQRVSYANHTATTEIDVGIIRSGTPKLQLFVGGEFKGEGPLTNPGAAVPKVVFGGNATFYLSQILITENLPTVGARVWTRKATANGAVQEMTGTYTALNKILLNDTTSVLSTAEGQTSTFVYQDVAPLAGMKMGEVWLWQRAQTDGTSPTNLKAVARIGSTNYTTANVVGMQVGFSPICGRFPVNPATSSAWSETAFNAAELGMQSAT